MLGNLGQPEFPIEQAAVDLIRGRDLLIDHYGEWPAFIDVEVIRLTLERAPTDYAASHTLRAVFSTFDIHRSSDDPLRKQAHTEILFSGISGLSISDWSTQNPIQGWSITRRQDDTMRTECFQVYWGGIGHEVRFDCGQIAIVDVMDLNPFQKSLSALLS
jgi:Immunity protein 50